MKLAKQIVIYGKVQNVGFRYNAMNMAKDLNIKGFIRNMPNGSIYIEAEGTSLNMDLFVSWCAEGPTRSNVEGVEVNEIPLMNYKNFLIKY